MFDDEPTAKRITPRFQGYTDRYACLDGYRYNQIPSARTHMHMALKDATTSRDHQALCKRRAVDTYPVITAKFTKSTPYFAIGNRAFRQPILVAQRLASRQYRNRDGFYM
ncbi:hypothetical protein [Paenibacillus larvae]|uniref:hypothetical protein n=1 Tax=Paenibacillus larvae TaxID=1464 RepID=UPI00289185D0|nr:hypothetical protein [Paenibacillus larvae]MDT2193410.1 hypothetical protein [Paenibacillus larvae]